MKIEGLAIHRVGAVRKRLSQTVSAGLALAAIAVGGPVVKADSGTTPVLRATLGGPGHALIYPGGSEIAADGGVVIADTGNDRVVKFSSAGAQVWTLGTPGTAVNQFLEPRDVGIDSSGNIFVADTGNTRVVELSSTGTWITSFKGPKSGRLSSPIGLTVTNNLIYVADGGQKSVRVFDTAGNQLQTVSTNGVCTFSRVRDADADSAGNIYVADYLNDDILKLSSTGTCITKWGSFGTGPGQFKNPYGVRIAVDPVLGTQAVYVADSNNDRIQEFTTTGTFVATIGGPGIGPGAFVQLRRVTVAIDGSGDVWGSDLWGFQVERFHRTSTGYAYAQTIGGVGPPLTSTSVFNQPHGISFDSAGNVAVVDTVNQRIVEMTPTGAIIGACGQRGFGPAEDNWPRGVAIDQATGQLWIADTKQSRIIVFNPAPGCASVAKMGNGEGTAINQFHWPFSIAIRQSDRTAWVADTKNNRIMSYNVSTRAPIAAFGTIGSGTGQFSAPSGIAIAPGTGHILVADANNNRIVELSDTGGSSIAVVRTLTDSFSGPQGVGADSTGRIYVADTDNSRMVVLKPDGSELGVVTTGLNQPANLAVNTSDVIYVADTLNDRVQVYSYPTTTPGVPTFVGTLEGPGLASMYPVDATSTATYYYVMDAGRYRVAAVNRTTGNIEFQTTSTQGSGANQFSDARAVDVDSSGNVYVADTANNRVEVFDSNLNYVRQFGGKGSTPGLFEQDYGIAVGQGIGSGGTPGQVVYITDGNGRIQKFDTAGNYISQFGTILNQPRQITIDPVNNFVFVVNARDRDVVVFDQNGILQFTFGSNGTGPGQFSDDPRGIGVSADGSKAYATDSGGKRVEVFDATNGNYKFQVGGPGPGAGLFINPRGLTVSADGHLLVTDEFGYGVHEFLLDGTPVRDLFGVAPAVPGVNSPRGVRVDNAGRIYMVDWWNQRIDSINANGSSPSAFGFRGTTSQPGSINFAWDLAIQPGTGWIYVANRESHEIEVFQPNGTYVTRWGTRGTANGQLQFPQGITFAPDGTLLEADSGNGRIQRFSIDINGNGTWTATYGVPGSANQGVGYLNVPTGISTASDGTIWVADTLNNSVQSMSPLGVWTRFTAPGGTHFRAPWGVTVAPDGSIWVSDTSNNRLVKMEPSGTFDWAADGPTMGAGPINPFSVAFGLSKHVYLSDVWNNRVVDLVTG